MTPHEPSQSGELIAELRALAPDGDRRTYPAGAIIFSAGEVGDGSYVVETGRVQISVVGDAHEPRLLATIGPGDFFGEMAVIDDAPRSATATAASETSVIFVSRTRFLEMLATRPQVALKINREFSLRIRALNRKYHDEILQAERLAVVGRFAGTIVHDFKNPLTVIGLAAELACSDHTTPPLRAKAQHKIARQIERMTDMLQELIEFTRPSGQRPVLRPVNFARYMNPLAEEIRQEIADRGVKVVLEHEPPAVEVALNPQRLSRLFYNLLNNAVDELPDGGTIFLRFRLDATHLAVEIEDTGRGIAPEIARTLFEPFATHGKAHGTGLGLTICKKIIEDHGGTIRAAASQPGKGAVFVFTLPLTPAA